MACRNVSSRNGFCVKRIGFGARDRNRTGTSLSGPGILSPVRLPVSPPGQGKNFHYHGIKLPQPPWGAFGTARRRGHLAQFALSSPQHTLPGPVRTAICKDFGRTVAHQKSRILPSAGESWRTSLFAAQARTIPNSTSPGARALRDGAALHFL